MEDLEKAIEYESRALALTPEGHPHLSRRLSNLGVSHSYQFQRLGDLRHIEKSIECYSRALEITTDDHPELCINHFNLALSHVQYHEHTNSPSHLHDSLNSFRIASKSLIGAPRNRFRYSRQWAALASEHTALNSIEAYQTTIDLLPQFIWLGATTSQRYDDLKMTITLARDAAAAATLASNYSLALEWLEHARCVVWNQSLTLRSPIDHLEESQPLLAARLKTVAHQLHAASSEPREPQIVSTSLTALEQVAQSHRRLAKEYDELLTQARLLPGFENFLRPMNVTKLVHAARNGPVIVIGCHEDHCDALIILPNQSSVAHISLPNFTAEKACQARKMIKTSLWGRSERHIFQEPGEEDEFGSVLAILWNDLVKPTLEFLGFIANVPTGNLPHVTWCPTGALSFLPLHAAGDYDQPRSRVFDYVISSYTPTLTALLASTPSTLDVNSRVLAVGQTATPGQSRLPGTARELACVKSHAENTMGYSQLMDNQATPSTVLDAMEQHDWVHLACHAHQNFHDPTKSGFFLQDGTLDLAAINQRLFTKKGLAFLSACQTATGDETLPDEAIHLASGMLMAGYSSVIATMWSVDDDDAPVVANKVYGQLMIGRKLGNGEAGKALHDAVAELRNTVGEKQFVRWVPYIHIGS